MSGDSISSGFNKEPINRKYDLYSLRVNRNIRVVFQESRDKIIFLWADKHDNAYAWADSFTKIKSEVIEFVPKLTKIPKPDITKLENIKFETFADNYEEQKCRDAEPLSLSYYEGYNDYTLYGTARPYFFAGLSERHFRKMGIEDKKIDIVRSVNNFQSFYKLRDEIGIKAYNILRKIVIKEQNIYRAHNRAKETN